MSSQPEDVTRLLLAWSHGDRDSAERLVPVIYDELRAIARGYSRRERRDHTLQATAIVHEAYVRLVEDDGIRWRGRDHFVGMAARLMRHVLVDHARHNKAAKRGGGASKVPLVEADALTHDRSPDLIALDGALVALARFDRLQASIVELRYFGGLTVAETAAHLEVSPSTVVRHWDRARAWLYRQLRGGEAVPA